MFDHRLQLVEHDFRPSSLQDLCIHQSQNIVRQVYVSGKKENGYLRPDLSQSRRDLGAIAAGHEIVEDDAVEFSGFEHFDAGLGILCRMDLVTGTFQHRLPDPEADVFIVNAKQTEFLGHGNDPKLLPDYTAPS